MNEQQLPKVKYTEFERTYERILEWFFSYPQEETSLSDLCTHADVSRTTGRTIVLHLQKKGFLEVRPLGKTWKIRANSEHEYFITKKIPSNLHYIYESGIIDWVKKNIPQGRNIILFGSYRRGEDTQDSDIDIAVETVEDQTLKIHILLLPELRYRKTIEVNIHIFSKKRVNINLFNSIANGIVLDGFLEVHL